MSTATTPAAGRQPVFRAASPLLFDVAVPVGLYYLLSAATALGQIADLVGTGLRWDLVLAYRDRQADIGARTEFVSRVVIEFATDLAALQVTGEANLTGIPDAGDGAYPGAADALVHGMFAAATAKRQRAVNVAVGFAVVPEREPATGTCWRAVAALGGSRFQTCVDTWASTCTRTCSAAGSSRRTCGEPGPGGRGDPTHLAP